MEIINYDKAEFRNQTGANIFYGKYALTQYETWKQKAITIVNGVCGPRNGMQPAILSKEERDFLIYAIQSFKFLPGGRYIYYAGRGADFWNNCYLLAALADTREEWADLCWRAMRCLMVGGGIGANYDIIRPEGRMLSRTGGRASGPLPLMHAIDGIGEAAVQGGGRRAAIYASLNWQHDDIEKFINAKNWHNMAVNGDGLTIKDIKEHAFNFHAPLEYTNISVNYDDDWLANPDRHLDPVFLANCRQAITTGEPGFSFNFGDLIRQILRNACTEVTSADDSDVCNLGSINIGNVDSIDEFGDLVRVASKFLVCGTVRAELPYEKVRLVREKNRRLGLGLMGLHEWLLKQGKDYVVDADLHKWMSVYETESESAANEHCDRLYLNHPAGYRAIAPTGSISMLAGTTSGIEPVYAAAYKRRYILDGKRWKYEYMVDSTAEHMVDMYDMDPDTLPTALTMAEDIEKRLAFQADLQGYVDHAISSTVNLPSSVGEDVIAARTLDFAEKVSKYAPRLRGLTAYPDGSRGGQPITAVPWAEAMSKKDVIHEENEICDISGKGGTCSS